MLTLTLKQTRETGEQNVNHVDANIDFDRNQEGETGEQNVNCVDANIDIETNQRGKGEEQVIIQEITFWQRPWSQNKTKQQNQNSSNKNWKQIKKDELKRNNNRGKSA